MTRDVLPGAHTTPTQRCPQCSSIGRPVLIGLADETAMEAAAAGELVLGGCMMGLDGYAWECPAGHEWTGDEQTWTRAVDLALAGRPRCRDCGGRTRRLVYPRALAHPGETDGLADDIAAGLAEMAPGEGPPGVHSTRICHDCRALLA
ncbi:hypothetical protein AB0B66_20060 [Catellatospora sp. NPDC049111]|uniref:hypothetical protein n=1 Tax=Catellatospora sp. NPDC049111 TaxID=3155271 RepID=UPI0033F899D2